MSSIPRSRPAPIIVERREEAEIALAREIAALVGEKRRVVLGLATGDTPAGVYRELARLRKEEGLDFGNVETFNLDEYLGLPPDHPATFARWTAEHVHAPLGIPPTRAHFLPAVPDPERVAGRPFVGDAACIAYERAIRDAGGIDLQILGFGRDGHIAFNEPGSDRDSRTRVVELHPWTREDAAAVFGGMESVPARAITMGIATILEARRIRVLVFGRKKMQIVQRALEGAIGAEVPATFLREHEDLVVWLDLEAGEGLAVARAPSSA
jgi:glucosamine-6-phosphate deaminase